MEGPRRAVVPVLLQRTGPYRDAQHCTMHTQRMASCLRGDCVQAPPCPPSPCPAPCTKYPCCMQVTVGPFLNAWFSSQGLSSHQIGLISAFKTWVSLPASFLWGALADYFSAHRAVMLGCLVASTGVLPALLAVHTFPGFMAMVLLFQVVSWIPGTMMSYCCENPVTKISCASTPPRAMAPCHLSNKHDPRASGAHGILHPRHNIDDCGTVHLQVLKSPVGLMADSAVISSCTRVRAHKLCI